MSSNLNFIECVSSNLESRSSSNALQSLLITSDTYCVLTRASDCPQGRFLPIPLGPIIVWARDRSFTNSTNPVTGITSSAINVSKYLQLNIIIVV